MRIKKRRKGEQLIINETPSFTNATQILKQSKGGLYRCIQRKIPCTEKYLVS